MYVPLEITSRIVATPDSSGSTSAPSGGHGVVSARSVKYAPKRATKKTSSEARKTNVPRSNGGTRTRPGSRTRDLRCVGAAESTIASLLSPREPTGQPPRGAVAVPAQRMPRWTGDRRALAPADRSGLDARPLEPFPVAPPRMRGRRHLVRGRGAARPHARGAHRAPAGRRVRFGARGRVRRAVLGDRHLCRRLVHGPHGPAPVAELRRAAVAGTRRADRARDARVAARAGAAHLCGVA